MCGDATEILKLSTDSASFCTTGVSTTSRLQLVLRWEGVPEKTRSCQQNGGRGPREPRGDVELPVWGGEGDAHPGVLAVGVLTWGAQSARVACMSRGGTRG